MSCQVVCQLNQAPSVGPCGAGIAVALYAPIAEAKKPKEMKVHSRDLSELHSTTTYFGVAGGFSRTSLN